MMALLAAPVGCIDDRPVDITQSEDHVTGGNGPADGGCVVVVPVDAGEPHVPLTKIHLDNSHYEGWEEGDDSYGPPEGEPVQCDETHPGYEDARCWDCHAEGTRFQPEDHDPRMQFWAWSCARGFPGSVCHGHGVNGCAGFSHGIDISFVNCTQAECHTKFHGEEAYLENHAMDNAPDPFCDACHDFYWVGWPEDDELYRLREP